MHEISRFAQALEAAFAGNGPRPPYHYDPNAAAPTMRASDIKEMSAVMRRFLGGRCGNVFANGPTNPRWQGFFRLIVNGAGPEDDPMRFKLFASDFKNTWFEEVEMRLQDGRDIQILEHGQTIPLFIDRAYVGILLLTDADKSLFGGRPFALLMRPRPDYDDAAPYDYFVQALSAA